MNRTPVDHLLATPAYAALARRIGEDVVSVDLRSCLDRVAEIVHAHPTVIPSDLTGVFNGGKRLRPLLVLAVAYAAGPLTAGARERAVAGTTAVELLHAASLVHDDIMDGARVRHGVETINNRLGPDRALVAGDLLLGHAHVAAAPIGVAAAELIGRTLIRLCEGQAEEYADRYDAGRTERSYFRSIEGKTGSLLEACCRMGALAAGHTPGTTAALGRFGLHLGVAFQLADDLLDLVELPGVAGKPVGHDIACGVYTYPMLWALRHDPRLRHLLSHPAGPDRTAAAEEAARRVRAAGALDATRHAIARTRERCLDALAAATPALGRDGVDLLIELALAVVPASQRQATGPRTPVAGSVAAA